ncbi:MAG TPA: hypothetical protein VK177_15125, partial [Flavobacteriales bacterium]|nr:hypothetical protein [Flavobacteriales bacterium]
DTANRFMPADTVNDKLNMQTIHRVFKNQTSMESGFYLMSENDTLYKFKHYYNAQGLLTKRILYDRNFTAKRYDSSIETEVFEYTYDNEGRPTSLSYKEGISEPLVFNLKCIMPDKYGNMQRMQVYDQYHVLLREVGWYMDYKQ